jgi:hypothetical protein
MMTIKLDTIDTAIARVLCERRGIDANRLFSDMLKSEAAFELVLQGASIEPAPAQEVQPT